VKKRILFRVDGGRIPEIGMGHVTRCLILARELSSQPGTEVMFLMRGDTDGAAYVEAQGQHVWKIETLAQEDIATLKCLVDFNPDIMVIDSLKIRPDYLTLVKKTGVILILLDYCGEHYDKADFIINPIIQDKNVLYAGYDYMVIPEGPKSRSPSPLPGAPQNVFVSFGGFDKNDMTSRFLKAAAETHVNRNYHVVVGSSYREGSSDIQTAHHSPHVKMYKDPSNFPELLQSSDVAIVSGGLTMYQATAAGIPSLVVSQYPHQQVNATRLEENGAVEYLGSADTVDFQKVIERVGTLCADEDLRRRMSINGRRLLDGRGNSRVASLIGIINRLEWDSAFFNVNIGYLYPKRLRKSIVSFAMKKCEEDRIECLYYLCDCNDPESVQLAEKEGFHFVDIRITFSQDVRSRIAGDPCALPGGLRVRPARGEDKPELCGIASDSYISSRYFFDRHFPQEVCRKFYADWISKSVDGLFDHAVLIAEMNGKLAGYISCRHVSSNYGAIGLVGIAPEFQGQRVGTHLVSAALQWFAERDIPFVHVVTQGRNLAAQRLYQSCGFRSEKLELWYHKWFREHYAH